MALTQAAFLSIPMSQIKEETHRTHKNSCKHNREPREFQLKRNRRPEYFLDAKSVWNVDSLVKCCRDLNWVIQVGWGSHPLSLWNWPGLRLRSPGAWPCLSQKAVHIVPHSPDFALGLNNSSPGYWRCWPSGVSSPQELPSASIQGHVSFPRQPPPNDRSIRGSKKAQAPHPRLDTRQGPSQLTMTEARASVKTALDPAPPSAQAAVLLLSSPLRGIGPEYIP